MLKRYTLPLARSLVGSDSPYAARVAPVLLILVTLLTASVLLWLGPVVTMRFLEDTPTMLDGGWRVFQGQVPHRDFYTPLGPVTPLIVAWGMVLAGPNATCLVAGTVTVFLLVSFWACAISQHRLTAVQSLLFSLYAGFLVAGTSVLGWELTLTGYSSLYNRCGSALLVLLLIEALAPINNPHRRGRAFAGGFSSGVLLVLLFFLKLNYAGVALLGLVFSPLVVSHPRTRWSGVVVGTVGATLGMLAYLRFDLPAIAYDLSLAVQARSGMMYEQAFAYGIRLTQQFAPQTVVPLVLVFLTWQATPALPPPPEQPGILALDRKGNHLLLAAFFVLAHITILVTNNQPEIPLLFPLYGLLLLAAHRCPHEPAAANQRPYRDGTRQASLVPLTAYTVLLVCLVLVPQVASIGYSAYYQSTFVPDAVFNSPSLSGLHTKARSTGGLEYIAKVNDGMALLRQHTGQQDRILVMDHTNPFSFGLLRPSPRGDALWWQEGVSFSKRAHPAPERVFADVSVVMLPQDINRDAAMWGAYGNYLHTHYDLIARSDFWRLFVRRPPVPPSP